jgi:hypothetical protein
VVQVTFASLSSDPRTISLRDDVQGPRRCVTPAACATSASSPRPSRTSAWPQTGVVVRSAAAAQHRMVAAAAASMHACQPLAQVRRLTGVETFVGTRTWTLACLHRPAACACTIEPRDVVDWWTQAAGVVLRSVCCISMALVVAGRLASSSSMLGWAWLCKLVTCADSGTTQPQPIKHAIPGGGWQA